MPKQANKEISIPNLVNIIHSLEQGKYIYQHKMPTSSDCQYIQLPSAVSDSFIKLKRSLNSTKWKDLYNTEKEFQNFLFQLVKYSRLNHWNYPTAEKAHAEYLLGFLLHQDFQIKIDERSMSLNNLLFRKLPTIEQSYFTTGSAYFWHDVPNKKYDFLIPEWRENQNYPTLEVVHDHWKEIISLKQRKIAEKAQAAQKREDEQKIFEQQQQWLLTHRFDHLTLDYKAYSYVLEGYLQYDRQHQPPYSKVHISPELNHLMIEFAQCARTMDNNNGIHALIVNHMFIRFLNDLFREAKYDNSFTGLYAKKLTGFLLFHNIKITDFDKVYSTRELFWQAATPYEQQLLFQPMPAQHLYFVSPQWMLQQNYPGKLDLEHMLSQSQPNHPIHTSSQSQYCGATQGQNVWLNAYQMHNSQAQFSQQATTSSNPFNKGVSWLRP